MRQLTQLRDERLAQRLSDMLLGQGIDNRLEPVEDGYRIWVFAEEHLDAARRSLESFEAAPDAAPISELAAQGQQRRQQAKKPLPTRHKEVDVRTRWATSARRGRYGQLTLTLILVCVGVFFLTAQGGRADIVQYLQIGSLRDAVLGQPFASVLQGEVWRLLTPIFLHFGMLHIFFNMWWLSDLGTMLERRQGALFLAGFVMVTGVFSNLAQYMVVGDPRFGGMSGVVYALLGYIWLRGRYDPASGYFLPTHIVTFMLVWMLLGFVGILGGIANFAHAGGLVAGAAWGLFFALRRRLRR